MKSCSLQSVTLLLNYAKIGRNKKGIQNKPISEERKQYLQSRNLNCSWFIDGKNNEISHANILKASAK